MTKVIGICNLHNEPHLGDITKNRPLAALSFLGRYGIIDFTLSNFSNSHIDKVYVLCKKGIVQIRKHIGSGSIWVNNTILGHIELLINEKGLSNKPFNTDINNIKQGMDLDEIDFDYAVIAPTYFLSCMDYRPIIKQHVDSGAAVTAIYKTVNDADREYINCDKYRFDANGKVAEVSKNLGRSKDADISMDTFILSKDILKKIVEESESVSGMYSIQDMINYYISENTVHVMGYRYDGFIVPILHFKGYVYNSLNLLNYHIRNQLFNPDWPIYTTTHNTPPALYGDSAEVHNSFIANGAIIKGKVYNSVISRDVVIEKGAEVRNCIIFTKATIDAGVKIDHLLCDKKSAVSKSKKVSGTDEEFIYIPQGERI